MLGVLVGFICLSAVASIAGIYFKILPPSLISQLPFLNQLIVQKNVEAPSVDGNQQNNVIDQGSSVNASVNDASSAASAVSANGNKTNNPDIKSAVKSNNISKVSRVYSDMKPEEAVGIFNGLDDQTVVALLQKMNEDQAAKILARMDAQRAGILSKELLQYKNNNNLSSN